MNRVSKKELFDAHVEKSVRYSLSVREVKFGRRRRRKKESEFKNRSEEAIGTAIGNVN